MNYQYTYEKYMKDLTALKILISKSQVQYDCIIGVVRGGCIPGVHLSNIMNIPFSPLIWSHTRDEKDRYHPHLKDENKKCLIIDDILDEGSTMEEIMKTYPDADTGVLIFNTANRFNIQPTYFAWLINRGIMPEWFDFWWEKV